jgi:hypothetical protein
MAQGWPLPPIGLSRFRVWQRCLDLAWKETGMAGLVLAVASCWRRNRPTFRHRLHSSRPLQTEPVQRLTRLVLLAKVHSLLARRPHSSDDRVIARQQPHTRRLGWQR